MLLDGGVCVPRRRCVRDKMILEEGPTWSADVSPEPVHTS